MFGGRMRVVLVAILAALLVANIWYFSAAPTYPQTPTGWLGWVLGVVFVNAFLGLILVYSAVVYSGLFAETPELRRELRVNVLAYTIALAACAIGNFWFFKTAQDDFSLWDASTVFVFGVALAISCFILLVTNFSVDCYYHERGRK
jgi:hypothetical protein